MNKMVELLKKHEEVVLNEDLATGYKISLEIYELIKNDLDVNMDYTDVMDILEEVCEEEVTFRYMPIKNLCESLVAYYKSDNSNVEERIKALFDMLIKEEEPKEDLDLATEIDFNETYEEDEDDDYEGTCIFCGEDIYDCCCHGCFDGCHSDEEEDEDPLDTDMCEEVELRLALKQSLTENISRYIDLEELVEDDKYIILQKKVKDTPTGIENDVVKHYFDTLTDVCIFFAEQVIKIHETYLGTDTETISSPLDNPIRVKEKLSLDAIPFVQTVGEMVELDSDYALIYGLIGSVEENEIIINQVYKVTEY